MISPSTCAHWHPNEPTVLKTHKRRLDNGSVVDHTVCATCNRVRQRIKYHNKDAPNAPVVRRQPKVEPIIVHDVLPRLNWIPPEFLLKGFTHAVTHSAPSGVSNHESPWRHEAGPDCRVNDAAACRDERAVSPTAYASRRLSNQAVG